MALTVARLPEGSRITDYVSLGVIARSFLLARVRAVLASIGKASVRERGLPAQLRHCSGALHAVLLSGSAPVSARRLAVAGRSRAGDSGGGPLRHLAGAHATGR